jgi:hypothetical protein
MPGYTTDAFLPALRTPGVKTVDARINNSVLSYYGRSTTGWRFLAIST